MDTAQEFETHRSRLFSLAYRMLGSAAEAEDAVQDAYLRWHGVDPGQVVAPGAWLAKVLTNLCLNRLTSARVQREEYFGPWIPEPVGTGAGVLGPMETAEQRDSVSFAVLTMMEQLSPPERAAVVLRDAFDYSHRDVAGVLDCSEANARQLYRRAKQHLADGRPRFTSSREQDDELLARFLAAASEGAMAQLEQLLADQVVVWSDGGGKASAASRPVAGRDNAARFLIGLFSRWVNAAQIGFAEVNGVPAVTGWADGELTAFGALELGEGGITGVRLVLNPDKLAFLATQLRELSQNG
ncbi:MULTISPECIES: RNA polymerase sigma-70 factor [unclassified Streptomyces]|uniref:RNA polymerase sigma-70 factor n=1 Tax=unclassified Streptomyces TaxID=2593676 RepID=UPI00202FDA2D|nr:MULTISPECIES: RNA polymerase sigma-70 factor [unclassified Streptomyces]MCM1965423.1 RNA polymerase sigma-70 factor [Streptomyces sp. G1]MCX5297391.1 RNA polymerase sigma-70 factor [Streptomyces sp. NBC_00193]